MQVDYIDCLLENLAAATPSDQGGCERDAYVTAAHIQRVVTREIPTPVLLLLS